MTRLRTPLTAASLLLVGGLVLTGCGASGDPAAAGSGTGSDAGGSAAQLAGSGSSAQEAAQNAWTQNYIATHPGSQITYEAVGSGTGREQFISGAVSFAGSDDAMDADEIAKASQTCQGGEAFDVPVYISPIAIVYHLDGVKDLQLSPATIAGIFSGTITSWNDPAIAKDNPDATLPDTKIVPVHRSDKSGTTGNLTDFLTETAPDAWQPGRVEEWPFKGGQAGEGTSGLISTVQGGEGTIGYADFSKAGDLGVAKVKVGDAYVAPTAEGASKAVEASPRDTEGRGDKDVVVKVDRTQTDKDIYPLVLVSYLVACDTYADAATADAVKAYGTYVVSADGQKAAAENAGSAPLGDKLSADAAASLGSISAKG